MPARKWFAIAKNEYRLHTSSIRKIRPFLPYLIVGLLAVYIGFIVPTIVTFFVDDFIAFILSQVAITMVQISLFMMFIYLLIFPITQTLQGIQAGRIEIFLAAPVKPSEVLLGEFLGGTPFFAIIITVIAGFFTGILMPLGLDLIQTAIIVFVFIFTCLSAIWIGTVIAAVLRTKFEKTARGRDIGRALSLILALPMIAVIYAIIGGGLLDVLADPNTSGLVRTTLNILPSSWGAEIIVGFASNPGDIFAFGFETLIYFGGIIIFFVSSLWLGSKVANRIYSIEPTTFSASKAKPDGYFYKTIRSIGRGKSFGSLLVSLFKDYSRRLENLSRIAYIVGLFAMLNIFFGGGIEDPNFNLIMGLFLFPLLAVLVVGQLVTGGKENIFPYKKTPNGVNKFVKAKLVQGLLVAVPIGGGISIISLILNPQSTMFSLILYSVFILLIVAGNVILALGLSILNPVFSENAREQMIGLIVNAQVGIFVSMGIFIGATILFRGSEELYYTLLLDIFVIWILGFITLYLGKRKIRRIE